MDSHNRSVPLINKYIEQSARYNTETKLWSVSYNGSISYSRNLVLAINNLLKTLGE